MRLQISDLQLELTQGDIAAQKDIEAVVNAANAELKIGGGVAGAIHRKAGSELEKACRPLAPIEPGEAVITEAFNLPNQYVIHTLGPVYGRDKPEAALLEKCYQNSLKLAEEYQIKSIAFPAISTGAFGYPIEKAAAVSLETIKITAEELENIKIIRFVLYSSSDFRVYKEQAQKIFID
ncbi:O-acetyl-ADP-ribose deacetylase (regulator of RNase III) [Halanaerobium saccharolyticum]|uniref:O-acetyl-ADP-ribose deacetylase (Regulator of RNase III) n=1 Tax=Halanaerobium saccharolyticum TaxID=43595 RepID=A0A4R7Z6Y9_9FIRM|nr:macro domain-containing protein [Halanaerobium saccharolyticum]RAK09313.1 O-acetyl-ADP-ribose deacetylase (regulator of RNase III) [Halanaerobium saccharolyticum]TDW06172.1 O-acetyl-ADP-ribose deacetylase (regulator of RNase III) [Halanaerobium saccharolyticum]TDX60966.1 O-acetyl-ADP-ribose deacetylase (regulator of RNase III) [Halanaerobium saccharolyticum]